MSDSATPAPAPVTPPAAATPPPLAGGTGLQPNIAAGLATIFTLVGGIIFLVLEKKNAFVRFYAMQSVFLGGAIIAASIAVRILSAIFLHVPLLGWLVALLLNILFLVVWLGWFVVYVIAIVNAFSNKEWEIPVLGPLARKQLASGPTGPVGPA